MKFAVHQANHIGGRKYNQDRVGYAYTKDALLLVLADGMGGHLHGEIAAQIAVQYIIESFQRAAKPMIQARSLFCIFNKNKNGSSATNMNAQLYSSATPSIK